MATKTAIEKGEERSAKAAAAGSVGRVWRRRIEQVDRIHELSARCARGDAQGGCAPAEGSEGDDGGGDRYGLPVWRCSSLSWTAFSKPHHGAAWVIEPAGRIAVAARHGIESGMTEDLEQPAEAETAETAPNEATAEATAEEQTEAPVAAEPARRSRKRRRRPQQTAAAAAEPQPVKNREFQVVHSARLLGV